MMFEKEAEEYIKIHDDYRVFSLDDEDVMQVFKDGAKFGYNMGLKAGKLKWHDLRKNPDDLPPVHATVIVYGYLGDMKDLQGFDEWDGEKWTNEDMPGFVRVAWCEIPKFWEE